MKMLYTLIFLPLIFITNTTSFIFALQEKTKEESGIKPEKIPSFRKIKTRPNNNSIIQDTYFFTQNGKKFSQFLIVYYLTENSKNLKKD